MIFYPPKTSPLNMAALGNKPLPHEPLQATPYSTHGRREELTGSSALLKALGNTMRNGGVTLCFRDRDLGLTIVILPTTCGDIIALWSQRSPIFWIWKQFCKACSLKMSSINFHVFCLALSHLHLQSHRFFDLRPRRWFYSPVSGEPVPYSLNE